MSYSQYPLQAQYYQYPQFPQKPTFYDAGYCIEFNKQPQFPYPEIIPYMSYEQMNPKYCYGCVNGIQNQEGHFGGCLEDPTMREYIQLPSPSPKQMSMSPMTPMTQMDEYPMSVSPQEKKPIILSELSPISPQELSQEPTLDYTSINITNKDYDEDEEFIDILKLTKKVWQPKQYKKFFEDPILACKVDKYSCEILNKYNEYIDINVGDWFYTYYHIPLDCLNESKHKSYLQDYIYKATPEIAEKLEHSIGSEIRYNIPTN